MEAAFGIEQILNGCLTFFYAIYHGGIVVFTWFSTPIGASGDETVDLILGDLAQYTPFELAFGVSLVTILFLALFKFLKDAIM